MIPIEDLKLRGVYRVSARNFDLGVWDGKGFVGRRHKFGWRLDREYHFDTVDATGNKEWGTAKPEKFLFLMPDHIGLDTALKHEGLNYALFGYLTVVEDELRSNPPDDGQDD